MQNAESRMRGRLRGRRTRQNPHDEARRPLRAGETGAEKNTTLEEVVAIQIAVRNISKRIFDIERNFKRRAEKVELAN